VGGGLAVHRGITHLRNSQIPDHPGWDYAVLAFAAAFEFYSWLVSYRELRSQKDPDESTWDEIIGSKDPTIFTVFLEDSAGLLGAVLAFLGIFLSRLFRNPYLDPAASIVIGLLLAVVAIFLGWESGALLIGERTNRARIRRVKEIITADPSVEKVGDLLTMQLGPQQVLLTVNIQFQRNLDLQQLELAIDRIETRVRASEPMIQRIFIEAESFKRTAESPAKAA
jgi:cation diffusion facilitator family transporter